MNCCCNAACTASRNEHNCDLVLSMMIHLYLYKHAYLITYLLIFYLLKIGRNGSIGPWRANVLGSGCVGWDKETAEATDWILNMARATSMMALILGCILTFYGFFKQCLCPLPCSLIRTLAAFCCKSLLPLCGQ